MDALLNEVVDPEDLKVAETQYRKERALGQIAVETEFQYAMCLIRSKYKQDWVHGLQILKGLYKRNEGPRRDYIYFIAFTQIKLEEFDEAIKCCKAFLTVEPRNSQIENMLEFAEKRKKKKALEGAAIVGGAGFALGLGIAAGALLLSKVARK